VDSLAGVIAGCAAVLVLVLGGLFVLAFALALAT
jgi:hypothetical protein